MSVHAPTEAKWTGGKLQFTNGPTKEVTVYTAASTLLQNYGVSVLTTQGVYKIEAPTSGCHAQIIVTNTTKTVKIQAGQSAIFGGGAHDVIAVAHTSVGSEELGVQIDLYGASTALWYVGTGTWGTSAPCPSITISSAT